MATAMFYTFFGICFICYIIRTSYYVIKNKGGTLAENEKFVTAVLIAMALLWFSWFFMVFNDPFALHLPSWANYIGLSIFIIGVLLFITSHLKIKGVESQKLETSGIYAKIRHPMYLGFIIWIIGFPLFTEGLFTLASAAIWIPHILYWRMSEERQLEKQYEDYGEYKKKTWF